MFASKNGSTRLVASCSGGYPRLRVRCLANAGTAKLVFSVPKKVPFGYSVGLVGSADSVGSWDPKKGLTLTWNANDSWSGEAEVPIGQQVEYKFFTRDIDGEVEEWQPGSNLSLDVPNAENTVVLVTDDWSGDDRIVSLQTAEHKKKPPGPKFNPGPKPRSRSQPPSGRSWRPRSPTPPPGKRNPTPTRRNQTPIPTSSSNPLSIVRKTDPFAKNPETPRASNGASSGQRNRFRPRATIAPRKMNFQLQNPQAYYQETREPEQQQQQHEPAPSSLQYAGGVLSGEYGNGSREASKGGDWGHEDDLVPSEDDLESLKVKDLRELLKEKNLRVSGRKAELIQRLREGWTNYDSE